MTEPKESGACGVGQLNAGNPLSGMKTSPAAAAAVALALALALGTAASFCQLFGKVRSSLFFFVARLLLFVCLFIPHFV